MHLAGSYDEVAASEMSVARGEHSEQPMVLVAQPSRFDPTRAPEGKHTLWGYCHVPNGSTVDMVARVEAQIERFAPGFRDLVLARHVMGPAALEARNPNQVGGDIGDGAYTLRQLFLRPVSLAPTYDASAWTLSLLGSDAAGRWRARDVRLLRGEGGAARRVRPGHLTGLATC